MHNGYLKEGAHQRPIFEFNAKRETNKCAAKTRRDGGKNEGDYCLSNSARFEVDCLFLIAGPDGKEPVGLRGNLLDENGFPRDDIDLWKVRIWQCCELDSRNAA